MSGDADLDESGDGFLTEIRMAEDDVVRADGQLEISDRRLTD